MKSSLFSVLAVVLVAACLTGCSVSAQKEGTMEEEQRKGGFMGMGTRPALEVTNKGAFGEVNRVVIGGFKVAFVESTRVNNKAGTGTGGNATALVDLKGVTAQDKQAITDQAYEDFIATLRSNGYTVEDRFVFTSYDAYAKVKQYDFPYTSDTSGIFSSYGKGDFHSPSKIGSKQPIFPGEVANVTGGIGHSNPSMAAVEFAEETGIAVINVAMVIDFVGSKGHGGKWSSTASVQVGQLMSVDSGTLGFNAGYGSAFNSKSGVMTFGQPVSSDQTFATIEELTTGTDKGVQTAANVFSAMLGSGTSQERKYTFHADPAKYRAAAKDATQKASELLVRKMVELR